MTNPYGVVLDNESVRWAAAESVSETVIAAVLLLHERSVDEIASKLTPDALGHVTRLVSRCPSCFPPGTLDALKARRAQSLNPGGPTNHPSAGRTNAAAQHLNPWTPPRRFAESGATATQGSTKRSTANVNADLACESRKDPWIELQLACDLRRGGRRRGYVDAELRCVYSPDEVVARMIEASSSLLWPVANLP